MNRWNLKGQSKVNTGNIIEPKDALEAKRLSEVLIKPENYGWPGQVITIIDCCSLEPEQDTEID
jgi:hypothetical protein